MSPDLEHEVKRRVLMMARSERGAEFLQALGKFLELPCTFALDQENQESAVTLLACALSEPESRELIQ